MIVTLPSYFPKTDNRWHETRLYRNQRGAYFLACEGGSLSRWAQSTPNGAIHGEGLGPISKDEALAYAKYAGLSPDRFVRAGFEQVEDDWCIDGPKNIEFQVIVKGKLRL